MSALLLFVLSWANASTVYTSCYYTHGEVVNVSTGARMSRNMSPRVLPGSQRIEARITNQHILVEVAFAPRFRVDAVEGCSAQTTMPGATCYRGLDMETRREIIVNRNGRDLVLSTHTGGVGPFFQRDHFYCSR